MGRQIYIIPNTNVFFSSCFLNIGQFTKHLVITRLSTCLQLLIFIEKKIQSVVRNTPPTQCASIAVKLE